MAATVARTMPKQSRDIGDRAHYNAHRVVTKEARETSISKVQVPMSILAGTSIVITILAMAMTTPIAGESVANVRSTLIKLVSEA